MTRPARKLQVSRAMLRTSLTLSVTLFASSALAEEPASRNPTSQATPIAHFTERPFELEARLGFGTSVGLLGVSAEVSPIDRLALGAGVGMNLLGPVWGAHLRVRPLIFPLRKLLLALTVEGAFSRGRYRQSLLDVLANGCEGALDDAAIHCYDPYVEPMLTSWAQLDLGAELRLHHGLSLRSSLGVARALSSLEPTCTVNGAAAACGSNSKPDRVIPVTLVAVGYAF